MPTVVPTPFLFRYAMPVKKAIAAPRQTGKTLLGLTDSFALPNLREVEGGEPNSVVRVCWNECGFGVSVTVSGKKHPATGNRTRPLESDGVQVWIDTRDTKNIHRAGRFCHHFCLLPFADGKKNDKPIGVQLQIARAREESVLAKPNSIQMKSATTKTGYELEAWFPAEVLHGYEPDANPRLGFYFLVRDSELRDWPMTIGEDFPYSQDPSLWTTLVLQENQAASGAALSGSPRVSGKQV
jgi:hypothetical protein